MSTHPIVANICGKEAARYTKGLQDGYKERTKRLQSGYRTVTKRGHEAFERLRPIDCNASWIGVGRCAVKLAFTGSFVAGADFNEMYCVPLKDFS